MTLINLWDSLTTFSNNPSSLNDPNMSYNSPHPNILDFTAFGRACYFNKSEAAVLLVAGGADISIKCEEGPCISPSVLCGALLQLSASLVLRICQAKPGWNGRRSEDIMRLSRL